MSARFGPEYNKFLSMLEMFLCLDAKLSEFLVQKYAEKDPMYDDFATCLETTWLNNGWAGVVVQNAIILANKETVAIQALLELQQHGK